MNILIQSLNLELLVGNKEVTKSLYFNLTMKIINIVVSLILIWLEAIRYNPLVGLVNMNNRIVLHIFLFFLIDPTVDALFMKKKNNQLLIKLNYFFS